jgi:hypothetical protein
MQELVRRYGRHPVSTDDDGGTWYYSYACKFAKINIIIIFTHCMTEVSFSIQFNTLKITKCFVDDYFSCRRDSCKLEHVSIG